MHAAYLKHAFAPHRHASFVTSVIDRGVGTIWYRGATWVAPAGSMVILNPDEIHTGAVYGTVDWTYRALYAGTETVSHIVSALLEHTAQVYFSATPMLFDPTLAAFQSHLTRRFKQVYGVTPGHIFQHHKNVLD